MARTIAPRRYRGATVSRELDRLLRDPRYAAAAADVASVVRKETGVRTACDAIERTYGLGASARR
jgi:hypothetical protein